MYVGAMHAEQNLH